MSRELTSKEKQRIKNLVTKNCANYDKNYGCLLLEGGCYMFTKFYANDKICKYFRNCLLSLDSELEAVFTDKPTKTCKLCGKKFSADSKKIYCSELCREEARKRSNAERVRRHREKKAGS